MEVIEMHHMVMHVQGSVHNISYQFGIGRNDNIERVLTLNSELCVYGEEPAQNDTWLKVTVPQIEGYRYILKSLTRQ